MSEDAATCYVTVMGVERIRRAGRAVALAAIRIDLDGLAVELAGVQIARGADGGLAVRRAGLPATVTPKALQHTMSTLLVERGAPGRKVDLMLGHIPRDRQMIRRYVRFDAPYLHEVASEIDALMADDGASDSPSHRPGPDRRACEPRASWLGPGSRNAWRLVGVA